MNKCLACHRQIDDGLYFCSITCACLCGYMHVRNDGPRKDISKITQEEIDEFLNNPPIRDDYPDKDKYL